MYSQLIKFKDFVGEHRLQIRIAYLAYKSSIIITEFVKESFGHIVGIVHQICSHCNLLVYVMGSAFLHLFERKSLHHNIWRNIS